jgi:hypothetical protein
MPATNVRNSNRYRLVLTGSAITDAIAAGDVIEVIEYQNEELGGVGQGSVINLGAGGI